MRNLNREAWFLYTVTSQEWFARAAQACEDFADTFNRLLTGHGLHGAARLDRWVQQYVDYATRIRSCAELIRTGDDYMPMLEVMTVAPSDWRGMMEQPMGWMTEEQRKQWDQSFDPISTYCSMTERALLNASYAGANWEEYKRFPGKEMPKLLNRDDGHVGDAERRITMFQASGELPILERYPIYAIDDTRSCKPGEPCPATGVWIPEQGLENYSLAFAVAGGPMQPAFEIVGFEKDISPRSKLTYPITAARDTTWHPVIATGKYEPPYRRPSVEGGQPGPESGWWWTPAGSNSLRYVERGQILIDFPHSKWGSTHWQWASSQPPKPGSRS